MMEDENGLELSLGLSCGGSSGKAKAKDVCLDSKSGESNRNKSLGGNFSVTEALAKPFLPMSGEKLDNNGPQQRNDPLKHQQENFWTDLGQHSSVALDAESHRFPELWPSNNKTADADVEKSGLNKRKFSFAEINLQKKQEKGVDHVGAHGKGPAGITFRNHVPLTTEDGSSGENEDVAESETEGSNSWLASHHEEKSRGFGMSKDKQFSAEQDSLGPQAMKQSNVPGHESSMDRGKPSYGIPLSLQPLPVMSASYQVPSKAPPVVTAPNTSAFPSGVMQLMPLGNNEQPTLQPMNLSSLQHAFGYSPVQLPTLEKNSSWIFGSQSQHLPPYGNRGVGEGVKNLEHAENVLNISQVQGPNNPPQTVVYDGKVGEVGKGSGKQVEETGTSSPSPAEDEVKANKSTFRPKEMFKPAAVEGFPHEGSAIKPGIAPGLKFGGSGSYPDLPWVSTTGPGPNGKTISGVTYKYSPNQVKIVCACHGFHMTPEEFIQHASGEATEANAALAAALPSSRRAILAQKRSFSVNSCQNAIL
ncbi:hypothetical protein Taro_014738 [Colocasia esculenta]|uniref:Ninja-family protein n=1 Tax=Colocasia esculenta TaxID=4460 RepID=A0A843UMQ1_COLES|nr:hypothetical protein [Colocasia esculenta]